MVIRFGFQQICMNKAQMNMREVLFNCPSGRMLKPKVWPERPFQIIVPKSCKILLTSLSLIDGFSR